MAIRPKSGLSWEARRKASKESRSEAFNTSIQSPIPTSSDVMYPRSKAAEEANGPRPKVIKINTDPTGPGHRIGWRRNGTR